MIHISLERARRAEFNGILNFSFCKKFRREIKSDKISGKKCIFQQVIFAYRYCFSSFSKQNKLLLRINLSYTLRHKAQKKF